MAGFENLKSLDLSPRSVEYSGSELIFRGTNQKAVMSTDSKDPGFYHFEYENQFFGSCSLEGKIRECSNQGLCLDRRSTQVEFENSRHEKEHLLEEAAIRFVNRQLNQFSSLAELKSGRRLSFWKRFFSS